MPQLTPELICLKDADAIDRVRLGPAHIGKLRQRESRLLLPQAKDLLALTDRPILATEGWAMVRAAANELGLWSPRSDLTPAALTPRHACNCC